MTERNLPRFIKQNSLKIASAALLPAAALGGAWNHEVQAEGRVFVNGGVWQDGANAVAWQNDQVTSASEVYRVLEGATSKHLVDAVWMFMDNEWHYFSPAARESSTLKDVPRVASMVAILRSGGATGGPEPVPTAGPELRQGLNREQAQFIFERINGVRREFGVGELKLNSMLTTAEEKYVKLLAETGKYDHNSDGTSTERARREGYTGAVGEVLARNPTSATVLFDQVTDWLNSPGHRATILNGGFKEIGVGCFEVRNPGGRTVNIMTCGASLGIPR